MIRIQDVQGSRIGVGWAKESIVIIIWRLDTLGRLKYLTERTHLSNSGQGTLQLIIPLIIILLILISIAISIPRIPTASTIALMVGFVIFIASFVSTNIALYILIFSMLLSPEFIVGSTEGATLQRGVALRLDDFILLTIGFSWLAKMSQADRLLSNNMPQFHTIRVIIRKG